MTSAIVWYQWNSTSSTIPTTVFSGSRLHPVFESRYAVHNATGELTIRQVRLEDAGTFTCQELVTDREPRKKSFDLAVLASYPSCSVKSCVMLEHLMASFELTCVVSYAGSWLPLIICLPDVSEQLISGHHNATSVTYVKTISHPDADVIGGSFSCSIYFDSPNGSRCGDSCRSPELNHIWHVSVPRLKAAAADGVSTRVAYISSIIAGTVAFITGLVVGVFFQRKRSKKRREIGQNFYDDAIGIRRQDNHKQAEPDNPVVHLQKPNRPVPRIPDYMYVPDVTLNHITRNIFLSEHPDDGPHPDAQAVDGDVEVVDPVGYEELVQVAVGT